MRRAITSIARRRLARSFLDRPAFGTGPDVVRALGAVQAQDYDGAKWGIAQRTHGVRDADLEADVATGRILRTHVLRPTWHFVDPGDIRWMVALTAPHVKRTIAAYDRQLGLDERAFRRSGAALEKALRGGNFLTRAEIKAVLGTGRVGPLGVQRTAHLLMRAELDALIVSGPRRGKQFTYALLDERAPAAVQPDRDWSLRELAARYFSTHGPATALDFGWWSGLPMADVRRAIDLAREVLQATTLGGIAYLDAGTGFPRTRPTAHLLPNYDEFFIGHRDRSAIGERLGTVKAVTGGNALIGNVVVVDGQLVGGWRRTVRRHGVHLDLSFLAPLTRAELARVERAARRYEAFIGAAVQLNGLPWQSRSSR